MTDYVILGLVKRHAELAGEAQAIRSRLAAIDADLVHLAAVILQFDPECDVADIRPKRHDLAERAHRGERSRVLLDVLREAGEHLTTAEIVRRTILRMGLDPEDRTVLRQLTKPIETALGRQEKRGVVRAIREPGRLVVWGVAG